MFYSLTPADMKFVYGFLASGLIIGIAAATVRILGEYSIISGTLPH